MSKPAPSTYTGFGRKTYAEAAANAIPRTAFPSSPPITTPSSSSSSCSSTPRSTASSTRRLPFAPRCCPVSTRRRQTSQLQRFRRLPFAIRQQQWQMKFAQSEAAGMLVEIEYEANWESPESKKGQRPAMWDEWLAMACRIYSPINAVLIPQGLIDKMVQVIQLRMSIQAWYLRERPEQFISNWNHHFFAQQMQVVLIILRHARLKSQGYNLV